VGRQHAIVVGRFECVADVPGIDLADDLTAVGPTCFFETQSDNCECPCPVTHDRLFDRLWV
jgi:hypothetical protein